MNSGIDIARSEATRQSTSTTGLSAWIATAFGLAMTENWHDLRLRNDGELDLTSLEPS